ncbi:MAG: mechanosensitive ion channel [Ruminiclostridium sp.]|nr:mechanosensitive ion channel [Ruminiclostridium sp.]
MLLQLLAAETTAAETVAETTPAPIQEEIKEVISETLGEDLVENVSGLNKLLTDIWNGFLEKLPTIVFAIILLILGIFLSKLVVKLMGKAMDRSKLDLTINHFIRSMVKIILYVLLITVILTLLGVPTTSIITVIGTAGVAVGLALQNSLSNLAGGFLILIAKPFKVGSYISVSGVEGTVESINILYTKLRTLDNKAVFVPNGNASNAVLTNVTESDMRRVDNVFSISYDDDYRKAVESINKAIAKCSKIHTDPDHKPFVRMCAHSASSIDIAVRVWCSTSDYWDVYFDVIEFVRAQFIEDGIEIPYQQVDVHMRNA